MHIFYIACVCAILHLFCIYVCLYVVAFVLQLFLVCGCNYF